MPKGKSRAVEIKPDEEWRVEDDMRTLMNAKEVQADSKRMAKVKALARKKLETVASVLSEGGDDC